MWSGGKREGGTVDSRVKWEVEEADVEEEKVEASGGGEDGVRGEGREIIKP